MNTEEILRLAVGGNETHEQNGSGAEVAQPENVVDTTTGVEDNPASAEIAADDSNVQKDEPDAPVGAESQLTDYWKQLEEKTGGLVKDEESLSQVLDRYSKYDEISKQKEELEANQFKPANDYVKTLNKLVSDGATKDQVKAFMKLNEWGDINEMSPSDLLVMQRVLTGGYSEETARYRVNSDFNLEDIKDTHGEDSIEYRVALDDLRIAGEKAKADLLNYRAEITTIDKPVVSENEQKYLDMIANQSEYSKAVESAATDLAKALPNKVTIGGIDFSLPKEFEDNKVQRVKDFFYSTGLPVNKESAAELEKYLKISAFAEHEEKIVDHIRKTLESELTEKISNKYENRSGIRQDSGTPQPVSADGEGMDSFLKSIGAVR